MARHWLVLAFWALATFALIVCNQFGGIVVPPPPPAGLARHVLTLFYLGLLLFTLMRFAQAAARLPHSARVLCLIGLPLALPLALLFSAAYVPSVAPALHTLRYLPPWLMFLEVNLFAPIGVALLGAAIGRQFRHPNTLLAAAGFAAFFDVVVVARGTVALLLQYRPHAIAAVSVGGSTPVGPKSKLLPLFSTVTIGPADVLFLSIFLAAVVHLALSERATFRTLYVLLLLGLAIAAFAPRPLAVPALAPMGVAVILANARHAAFTRAEKFALAYGSAFALLLAVVLVAGARTLLAR